MSSTKLTTFATLMLAVMLGASLGNAQTVIYVDDDAGPGGDVVSWATAYDSLSTALTAA